MGFRVQGSGFRVRRSWRRVGWVWGGENLPLSLLSPPQNAGGGGGGRGGGTREGHSQLEGNPPPLPPLPPLPPPTPPYPPTPLPPPPTLPHTKALKRHSKALRGAPRCSEVLRGIRAAPMHPSNSCSEWEAPHGSKPLAIYWVCQFCQVGPVLFFDKTWLFGARKRNLTNLTDLTASVPAGPRAADRGPTLTRPKVQNSDVSADVGLEIILPRESWYGGSTLSSWQRMAGSGRGARRRSRRSSRRRGRSALRW